VIDIHAAMAHLAAPRPLFHSEADFQHALAWRLQQQHPQISIRLEYRYPHLPKYGYVDIWIADGEHRVAIELKYKTRGLQAVVNDEAFDLKDQSAQDLGRYDTLKDLQRLEQIVASAPYTSGFLLLLTNDRSYWNESSKTDSADAAFRLHEQRTIAGELTWGAGASASTIHKREAALLLSGSYLLNWRDYSRVSDGTYGRFRYVLVSVN
jgi:hypothetical protein